MKKRELIQDEYKWDLSSLCKNDEDFENNLKVLEEYIEKVKTFKGKLKSKNTLFRYFEFCRDFSLIFNKTYTYANCRLDQDHGNSKYINLSEKVQQLSTRFSVANSFAEVEICSLSEKTLLKLMSDKKFSDYSEVLRYHIKNKKHMLSLEKEEVIAEMGDFLGGAYDVFSKYANVDVDFEDAIDSKGKKHKVDNETASIYMQSEDRVLRKSVSESIAKAFKQVSNTLGTNYANYIKQKVYFSKLRGYKSCLDASLYSEDIDRIVYDKLVAKVNENMNIHFKTLELIRKVLKLKKLASYDVYAPFVKNQNKKITIEKAFNQARDILQPLGQEYIELFDKSIKEKWYDIFPNKGKRIGAYSSGAYGANPIVLLNFDGYDSYVDTIIHEFGHSAHTYYSNKNQPYAKSNYGIFAAEIASTVNENLNYFYKKDKAKTKNEKLKVYHDLLHNIHAILFNQTMFSECEQLFYETVEKGDILSPEKILEIYDSRSKKYFGKNVDILPDQKYKWADIPHFFYDFYVYMYVTGFIAAFVIAKRIYSGDSVTREQYFKFLKSGCSKPPIELLKEVGVDFTTDAVYDEVFESLKLELQEFEKLIKV